MNQALDLMRARLQYHGGIAQQDRMIKDKRKTLDKVTLYSYQGAKVRKLDSENGQADPALINPNKVKQDYDDKILSIGYEYNYKPGTIFEWLNTGTYWLIYLQDLTELAYFKGDIRKCNYIIKWYDEDRNELSSYAAVRGPMEGKINTMNKSGSSFDLPNFTLNMLLPASPEVVKYFKRYSRFYLQPLKENDEPICWRVEGIDAISMPGVIEIAAVEYYSNEQTDDIENGIPNAIAEPIPQPQDAGIQGEIFIKPKKSYTYKYLGDEVSEWVYDKRLPIEAHIQDKEITIKWTTTYSGEFILQYGNEKKTIVIESLF